jgi:hypothetical protein
LHGGSELVRGGNGDTGIEESSFPLAELPDFEYSLTARVEFESYFQMLSSSKPASWSVFSLAALLAASLSLLRNVYLWATGTACLSEVHFGTLILNFPLVLEAVARIGLAWTRFSFSFKASAKLVLLCGSCLERW